MSMSLVKSVSWGAATLMGAALLAGPALADGMPSRGRIATPESRVCSTSANVGLTSDYVFRGISQNGENAAIQGGVDFSCGRFYVGFWGSSSEGGIDSTTEVDVYAGVKGKLGRFAWDLGAIYYGYPGSDSRFDADYFEFKASGSTDVWKGGNLAGTVYYSPDYAYSTGPVTTLELTFAQELPKFSIFSPTFSATVGHSYFSDNIGHVDPSYTYWNVGVTLGFAEKWSLDLRYWDTDDDAEVFGGSALTGDRFLATIKYTF